MRRWSCAGVATVGLIWSALTVPARALEDEPSFFEGFFGTVDPAIVYYDTNGELTSFRFPTEHGVIVGGKTVHGNRTTVKVSLEGAAAAEQLTLTSEAVTGGTTQSILYFSATESVTFLVSSTSSVVLSTTVQYCDEIPQLALFDAVRDATVATNSVTPAGGVVDASTYFFALNQLLKSFDYAAPVVTGCGERPQSFATCAESASVHDYEECLACCDVGSAGLAAVGLAPCLALGYPVRTLCAAAVRLVSTLCNDDCTDRMLSIPAGQSCGNRGHCEWSCGPGGYRVAGFCGLLGICCRSDI